MAKRLAIVLGLLIQIFMIQIYAAAASEQVGVIIGTRTHLCSVANTSTQATVSCQDEVYIADFSGGVFFKCYANVVGAFHSS
jgi:hypothetical protein